MDKIVSESEYRAIEITEPKKLAERKDWKQMNKQSIIYLWGNTKRSNIYVTDVLEQEEKVYGIEKIYEEIMAENF